MPEGGKRTRETVVPFRIFAAPFLKAQLELIRLYIALSVVQGDCRPCGYSALNAYALKLTFSAFFIKNASVL